MNFLIFFYLYFHEIIFSESNGFESFLFLKKIIVSIFMHFPQISSDEQVKKALSATSEKFGTLNVLVNCAGVAFANRLYSSGKRQMMDLEKIQKTINVGKVLKFQNLFFLLRSICWALWTWSNMHFRWWWTTCRTRTNSAGSSSTLHQSLLLKANRDRWKCKKFWY